MKKTILLVLSIFQTFQLYSSFVVFLNGSKLRTLLNKSIENFEQISSFEDDVRSVAQTIAEEMQASGVIDMDCAWPYINSTYDITLQVTNALKKRYSKNKKTIPSFVDGCKSASDLLYQSIINGSVEYMHQAAQDGADINFIKNGKPLIFWAITFHQKEMVKALILKGARLNHSLVQHALDNRLINAAIVIAIKCEINLNAAQYSILGHEENYGLLEIAARFNDFESVLLLLNNKVACSGYTKIPNGRTLMESALIWGGGTKATLAVIQELINRGYDINSYWAHFAAFRDVSVLRLFINNGADPNFVFEDNQLSRDDSKWTPVLKAIAVGAPFIPNSNSEILKILMEAGADINQSAHINRVIDHGTIRPGTYTPLALANALNRTDMVKILTEHGAYFE